MFTLVVLSLLPILRESTGFILGDRCQNIDPQFCFLRPRTYRRVVDNPKTGIAAVTAPLRPIKPGGPFERALACLLMAPYKCRLWAIAVAASF